MLALADVYEVAITRSVGALHIRHALTHVHGRPVLYTHYADMLKDPDT